MNSKPYTIPSFPAAPVSAPLAKLYKLVLKEGFHILCVEFSDYKTKNSVFQKTSVSLDGYHECDPYDYKHYTIEWISDGTGKNFDFFFTLDRLHKQIMQVSMIPSKFLTNKSTFNDVVKYQNEPDS